MGSSMTYLAKITPDCALIVQTVILFATMDCLFDYMACSVTFEVRDKG